MKPKNYLSAIAAGILLSIAPIGCKEKPRPAPKSGLETKVESQTEIKSNRNEINYENIYEEIVEDEGFRNTAYPDKRGNLTIGIGFNLEKKGAKQRIEKLGLDYEAVCNKKQKLSNQQVCSLMIEDVETAVLDSKRYVGKGWNNLDSDAKEIIINMAYNLGYPKLSGFKKLKQALIEQNYQKAAEEMKDSRWYYQTGDRAEELVERMNQL